MNRLSPQDRARVTPPESAGFPRKRKPGGGRKALGPGKGRDAPRHTVQCSDAAWQSLCEVARHAGFRSLAAWGEAMAAKKP